MTIARAAAIASLIVAIVAVGVLMFGSGGGTEYTLHLQSANQLVKGNEVKVGGLAIGEVTDIQLSEDNQANVKITINDKDFAPLHEGTEATVRVDALCPSVANRYISLAPGPNNAPKLKEGGTLETDTTTNAVDLDQLFNTLDPKTRTGLQKTLQGFATWYVGQGDEPQPDLQVPRPVARQLHPCDAGAGPRPEDVHRSRRAGRACHERDRLASRRPHQPGLERQHVRARHRRGERVLRPRARGLPAGARAGAARHSSTCAARSSSSTS